MIDAGHWNEPPDHSPLWFLTGLLGFLIVLNVLKGALWLTM